MYPRCGFLSNESSKWNERSLKTKRWHSRGNRVSLLNDKDITLKEYADSKQALSGRRSKAFNKANTRYMNRTESASAAVASSPMDEIIDDIIDDIVDDWCNLEMSDDETHYGKEEQRTDTDKENMDVASTGVLRNGRQAKPEKYRASNACDDVSVPYAIYPAVIWYLVSSFIHPEDIATFSCLCRDTYAVTNTAAFWRTLYDRFHTINSKDALPADLHRTRMERTYGLRSLVIRSLQFIHPPFQARITPETYSLFQKTVDHLSGVTFMYHVCKREQANYIYYLKFRDRENRLKTRTTVQSLNRNEEIYYNPYEGHCVLMVVCKQPQYLDPERIMGQEILSASVSVNAGMMYNKIRLVFQEPGQSMRGLKPRRNAILDYRTRTDLMEIILDPVLYVRLFYWWHPLFHTIFMVDRDACLDSGNQNIIW